jgi:hypothetical protein
MAEKGVAVVRRPALSRSLTRQRRRQRDAGGKRRRAKAELFANPRAFPYGCLASIPTPASKVTPVATVGDALPFVVEPFYKLIVPRLS